MPDELELSDGAKAAIDQWIDDGAEGDLNEHLDALGFVHPDLYPTPNGDGGIPDCPSGQYAKSSYVHVGGGKTVTVWTCVKA